MRLSKTKIYLLLTKKYYIQAALAEAAGVSRQTLSAVLNGRNCRPELLGKIAKALDVEPSEIIED